MLLVCEIVDTRTVRKYAVPGEHALQIQSTAKVRILQFPHFKSFLKLYFMILGANRKNSKQSSYFSFGTQGLKSFTRNLYVASEVFSLSNWGPDVYRTAELQLWY